MRCCRKDTFNVESARVCSEHFEDSCFIRNLQNELLGLPKSRRILQDDVLPTKHLSYRSSPVKSPSRGRRAEKRKARVLLDDMLKQTAIDNDINIQPDISTSLLTSSLNGELMMDV